MSAPRPDVTRPGVTRPGVTRPGVTRPGVTRPGVTRPGAPRLEWGRGSPRCGAHARWREFVLVACAAHLAPALAWAKADTREPQPEAASQERRGAEGLTWLRDFDLAAARAKEEGKDLLVDFTGSDWCVWCARLDAEVFQSPAFRARVAERFVLVELDFPRGELAQAAVPRPDRQEALKRRYAVSGFPTVLVVEPNGDLVCRQGYPEGGVTAFLAELDRHLATRAEIDAAVATCRAARAVAPAVAADVAAADRAALELLERHASAPSAARLASIVRPLALAGTPPVGGGPSGGAQAVDPKAPRLDDPRWRPTRALVGARLVDAEVVGVAQELDPANSAGLYELAVRAFVLAVTDTAGARRAVEFAEALAKVGAQQQPELTVDIWTNASDWAALVVGDELRARWFARMALRGPLSDLTVRARLESRAGSR
ncbi:MAG: thioredoxin family protein [Planctomycetota bacterium]